MSQEKKTAESGAQSSAIWGGRFESGPAAIMEEINVSIDTDKRLWRQDIRGSKAHCRMLADTGVIGAEDAAQILDGLSRIEKEIEAGTFPFERKYEDIHMNVEMRLRDLIGEAAGRLHTARSRNDQVATSFRLWVRDAADAVTAQIETLQKTLGTLSADHHDTAMPGFTHLQTAQPVTLGLHLDAYRHMLARDHSRFTDCRQRLNESPLGAAALAGTPFPIDRDQTAAALGFVRPMPNTIDAVSSRDFATEFLFCAAQCGLHLSRLAEEIVLWATPQFGFLSLSDSYSTGSSIMPQKKNPDAAELVRAKTGRLAGNLVQLMTVMKALPLAYNKDMQEDKACVFESFDTITLCLAAINGMLETMEWKKERMREAAESGFSTATRLADWLVMTLGTPFRDAHHVTGKIVRMAEERGIKLYELPLADMQAIEPRIDSSIFSVLKI